eukprot:jgi/Galph1/2264/GphlegSOOS_G955.1
MDPLPKLEKPFLGLFQYDNAEESPSMPILGQQIWSFMSQNHMDDPRRPSEVIPFQPPQKSEETNMTDFFSMTSMSFGMLAVVMKVRHFAWFSLIMAVAYASNCRFSQVEIKQIASAIGLSMVVLLISYLSPVPPPRKP